MLKPIPKSNAGKLKFLISAGVQAPSSHNTQPWLFSIQKNQIIVRADFSRSLPLGDPHNRELYASVGASIANILLAAKALGIGADLDLVHKDVVGEDIAAVITLKFSPKHISPNQKLLSALWDRRTNRTPYQTTKPIPARILKKITSLASFWGVRLNVLNDRSSVSQIAKMVEQGMFEFLSKKAFRRELSGWIRHDWSKKGDGLPGYSIGMPGIISIMAPILIQSTGPIKEVAASERKVVESCHSVAVVTVPKDERIYWLKTGIAFEQIAIELHLSGISTAVLTAAVESPKQRLRLKKIVKGEPSLFFRLGYATGGGIAVPRRDGEHVLV